MNPIKRILCAGVCLVLLLSVLGGCSRKENPSSLSSSPVSSRTDEAAAEPYRIGLIQYGEDPTQDMIREAFMSRLEEWNYNEDLLSIDYQNAGGDETKAETICGNFVRDEVDMIVAISTPAAQTAGKAAGGKEIGLIAAAGPAWTAENGAAGITVQPNVQKTLELALSADKALKVLGLLYDPEDPDSKAAVEEAKAWCAEKGVTAEESPVTEPQKAAEAMAELYKKAGAVYTPGGGLASVTNLLAAESIQAGKPWYAGSDAMVQVGALAAVSVDHTEVGNKLADLVVERMAGREPISSETLAADRLYVNQGTLGQLPLSLPEELLQDADFYTETVKEADKA